MTSYRFDPRAAEVETAKLQRRVKRPHVVGILVAGVLAICAGLGGNIAHISHATLILGLGILLTSFSIWLYQAILSAQAKPFSDASELAQILPPAIAAGYRSGISAADLWRLIGSNWEARFVAARFGLPPTIIDGLMADGAPNEDVLIMTSINLSQQVESPVITIPALMVALICAAPRGPEVLTSLKLDSSDLSEAVGWVSRLEATSRAQRPIYGGLARDWAAGFTPTLNQFASNFSQQVEAVRGQFIQQERTTQLDALTASLVSGNMSTVLVGETGIGKTALLYGLADRLLRGDGPRELRHYQVVSLSASTLMAQVQGTGDLERIVLTILSEAVGAANIIVALDEAQLFFGQGAGAVNLSQVLLPIVQSRRLKLVLTLSAGDWQRLRSTNVALAGLLTPLVLTPPDELSTLRLLADRALMLESGHGVTTWQAIRAAHRLSARYNTEMADPGRSLKLLEASYNFADGDFVTASSVEQAIESQYGVKVQAATSAETDVLLNLEDHIHERMINQTRAVSVVASALRRARAGVSNPNRPIGSFLFLGPTGVGKTELARSLAALYFGAESAMIRLDMSEYQQTKDIDRLLASASTDPNGFLPKMKQQPFSVVLFDEIEKANPGILNLLLQLLDEGKLTDSTNKPVSFKDAIIIATSNAGADDIRARIEAGQPLESFESEFTDKLISSGTFKPELLNRFDEIVLFRPLTEGELGLIVKLMVKEVNITLQPQKVTVELSDRAIVALVERGYDPRLGARPMRRMVQRTVEDAVAGKILRGEAPAGTTIKLDVPDLNLQIKAAS